MSGSASQPHSKRFDRISKAKFTLEMRIQGFSQLTLTVYRPLTDTGKAKRGNRPPWRKLEPPAFSHCRSSRRASAARQKGLENQYQDAQSFSQLGRVIWVARNRRPRTRRGTRSRGFGWSSRLVSSPVSRDDEIYSQPPSPRTLTKMAEQYLKSPAKHGTND